MTKDEILALCDKAKKGQRLSGNERQKLHMLKFLPLMHEIDAMGHNPVEVLFGEITVEAMEVVYVAWERMKTKNPQWYKSIRDHVAKNHICC